MAQFGSVIPNAVRELTRPMFASFLLVRSLTAFGMTDRWEGEFRSFFVAGIGGELKSGPFS